MKTAITIPDDVFEEAERLAQRLQLSRSRLYADALREYLARRDPAAITEAMNRLSDGIDTSADAGVAAAARRVLQNTEW